MTAIPEAASVLLARDAGSAEVFLAKRSSRLRFFGGFYVFPGGRVDGADAGMAAPGSTDASGLSVRRVAAARELFEETGVLVARRPDSSFPRRDEALERARREMVLGGLAFSDVLRRLDASIRGDDFTFVGSLTTPAFTSIRFDTSFFVANLPADQLAEVWPGELEEGRWGTASDWLGRWNRGELLIAPPTLLLLESIRGRPVAEAPGGFVECVLPRHSGSVPIIDFAPAVQMIPLRTVALPPATHTNAYLIGAAPAYLLDPGPSSPDEQQALFRLLDAERAGGKRLAAVILSHHHPDHVGAAAACARRYDVPIWAHALTGRALAGPIAIQRELADGEWIDLGTAPDGTAPWRLEVIHTPGHAAGHLAFHEPHYGLLFAGDMVSTVTSIIIAPPEGDLAVYLASLARLRRYPCRLLLPSHGTPSARADELLAEALDHRLKREEQLVAALSAAPRAVDDLALELYRGLPGDLMRFARLQVEAGLEKLRREGRAIVHNAGTEPTWSAPGLR